MFSLQNQTAHESLLLSGRQDSLIMGVNGLLQLKPQIFPIIPKDFDLLLLLLPGLQQLLHFFPQPDDL